MDEAFAERAACGLRSLERNEAPSRVAHNAEHWVHDEADCEPALSQLPEHRVEEEWHVVIHDLQYGIAAYVTEPDKLR